MAEDTEVFKLSLTRGWFDGGASKWAVNEDVASKGIFSSFSSVGFLPGNAEETWTLALAKKLESLGWTSFLLSAFTSGDDLEAMFASVNEK